MTTWVAVSATWLTTVAGMFWTSRVAHWAKPVSVNDACWLTVAALTAWALTACSLVIRAERRESKP